ncbi:MAG: glycosyltransferase family 2 protein [Bacteroidia bacterium]
MSEHKTAVVILNWNGKHYLEKFLPSVIQHSPEAAVIIADNLSTDDSVSFLKEKFPSVQLILNNANGGFAKGYNDSLKKVSAEYYILLNSDVEVSPNWIAPLLSLMEADKSIAACQPKILAYHDKASFEYAGASGGYLDKYGYPFCRGRIFSSIEKDKGQYNDAREVFWATGACMVVRSEVYHEMEGFDEDYFAHMEEIDLCWRMKNLGHKIYVQPASVIYHVGGGTLNKISPRKTYLNFRNNLVTFTKNHSPHYLWIKIVYRMVLDGVAAFKFLSEGEPSHFMAVLRAHAYYYAHLPSTLAKRKKLRAVPGYKPTTSGIFKGNIVTLHFLKKVQKFTQLNW